MAAGRHATGGAGHDMKAIHGPEALPPALRPPPAFN